MNLGTILLTVLTLTKVEELHLTTSTDVEELSATLGLGYSFRSDNTTLELAYEADANDDDYLGHYGSIKIVSKF